MNSSHKSMGHVALTGVFAGSSAQVIRLVIQLASIAIMARLLTQSDFGLVAEVLAVVGIADLFREMGLSAAAIQAEELSDATRSNLWWLNTILGLGVTLIVMACSPLIAMLFHDHRLVLVTIGLAPMFFLNGVMAQFRASLVRRLEFPTLARIDVTSQLVGTGTGLVCAFAGLGYWALVAQQIAAPAVMIFVVRKAAGWWPQRIHRGVGTKQFLSFGSAVLGSSVLTAIALSFDSVVIGRFFGASAAGVYNRAGQLVRTPLKQVATPINSVLLPIMSRVQNDNQRLSLMAARVQLLSTLPFIVVVAVLAGAAPDVTSIFLGPHWGAAAPIMICIGIQSAFRMLSSVGAEIMTSRGLGRQLSELAAVTLVADVAAVLVGSHWGVNGTAIGVATAPLANWVISFWWIGHHSGVEVLPMVRQGIILTIIGGFLSLSTWWAVNFLPKGWHVVRLGASGLLACIGICSVLLVPSIRKELKTAAVLLRNRRGVNLV